MKLLFIILGLLGLAAICYGAYVLHPALGYIISGIAALLLGEVGYNSVRKRGR